MGLLIPRVNCVVTVVCKRRLSRRVHRRLSWSRICNVYLIFQLQPFFSFFQFYHPFSSCDTVVMSSWLRLSQHLAVIKTQRRSTSCVKEARWSPDNGTQHLTIIEPRIHAPFHASHKHCNWLKPICKFSQRKKKTNKLFHFLNPPDCFPLPH
jgi:hypothetical protein